MNDETQAPQPEPQPGALASTAKQTAKKAKPKAKAKPAKKAAPKAGGKAKAKGKGGTVKGPGVLRTYAPGYHKDTEKKTAGGHVSVDNDDQLAKKLRGKDLDAVYKEAAKVLKEPEADLRKAYKHLNPGMQRMNLGNRMRAAV